MKFYFQEKGSMKLDPAINGGCIQRDTIDRQWFDDFAVAQRQRESAIRCNQKVSLIHCVSDEEMS